MGSLVTAIFSAINGIFTAINNVFGQKNTPEMKERDKAQKETNYQSDIEQALKEKDIEKVRNSLS
jgi:hypothetical protein